jgi:hypothetical protein
MKVMRSNLRQKFKEISKFIVRKAYSKVFDP